MPTTLVTGSPHHARGAALILKADGFEVLSAEPQIGQRPAGLGQGVAGHMGTEKPDAVTRLVLDFLVGGQ